MTSKINYALILILALLSQSFLIASYAHSATHTEASILLKKAQALNEQAASEGSRWIIAIEHLKKSKELMLTADYIGSVNHAEKAIYFLNLGINQKQLPLYQHK